MDSLALLPGQADKQRPTRRRHGPPWPTGRNGTFDACGWPSWLCAFRMGETLADFNLACLVLSSMLSWGRECEHLTIQIKQGHHAKRDSHRSEVSGVAWARWSCHPAKPAGNCTQSVCAFLGERVRTPDHTNQASPLRQTSKTIEMNLVVSRGLASPATRPSRQTKTTETTARPTLVTQASVKTIEVKLVVSWGIASPVTRPSRPKHHQDDGNHRSETRGVVGDR